MPRLRKNDFVPLYYQMQKDLEHKILSGEWREGQAVPSEKELCALYGVSGITARRALSRLVRQGLITRHPGVGSFVSSQQPRWRILLLVSGFGERDWMDQSPMFGALVGGIGEVAWEHNAVFSMDHVGTETELEPVLASLCDERLYDGILLRVFGDLEERYVRFLEEERLPYVAIKRYIPGRPLNCVVAEDVKGAYLATSHLVHLGHRRIAIVLGRQAMTTNRDLLKGYESALAEGGLEVDHQLIYEGARLSVDEGLRGCLALLGQERPPTAIFVTSDVMVPGAYSAAASRGLAIPDDISIVGCDDVFVAATLSPPLTTLRVSYYDFGREAARLLLSLLNRKTVEPARVTLEPHLVVRHSTVRSREALEV